VGGSGGIALTFFTSALDGGEWKNLVAVTRLRTGEGTMLQTGRSRVRELMR
jgi:predicted butyrate kinase (DUF1464 family)